MKRTELKRKAPMKRTRLSTKKPMLKKTKLNKMSKNPKKVKERKMYKRLRKIYLDNHPTCECGTKEAPCPKRSTDIHHKAGRASFLNRVDTWMAVSRECHDRIHANPTTSYERGHLINGIALASKENRNKSL